MVMSPRLDLRQTQSLVMTPQLQQAIKLLQLSNMELSVYVDQELERNPLLERDDSADVSAEPDRREERADSAETQVLDVVPGNTTDAPLDQDFNTAAEEGTPSDSWAEAGGGFDAGTPWGSGTSGSFDDTDGGLEQMVAGPRSLRDHLSDQITLDLKTSADRLIAHHLMGMLDDAGYLIGALDEVADSLGCSLAEVERVLGRLQAMDPPGLFARSLKECLAIQLADLNRLDPAMQALLDHLEMLGRRDIAGLLKICGVDHEDMMGMIAEIRALDPKPALRFENTLTQPVIPDVLMRPDPAGGWLVELNSETLPRVLINNRYHARLSRSGDKETRTFLSENLATANWLVKSLDQRANTILKVATELVRQQDAFFLHGVRHLRPLILRDIAEAIEMHESTVSRVTSNKYIASPRGIFELKYFFTQAIGAADGGESHSAEAVRDRIRSLIEAESPDQVLSDDKLVDILRADGIDIARRTVAKYREGMRIASSVRRKKEKSERLP
ncbi:RNA polymerase sigma-54 factor [Rhodospirillum rubrum]|uniref:RNA polymerase factor sigma-54 n=1 Tax=Rhodospirillum rubrum TaxID=1085 RepID=UPI001905475F|nr:RNA polymerase factor sigma-54 [Rhodospirillum rubrum]MBK1664994.1 RNA polymerase sigma-54 factor [Rhodospirillum rubrum]MBK1677261.1 RNA polymerase sigma-54 factor [Rhodospirillum rubrum]